MGYEADGERRMKILSLCEEFRSNNQISNEVFEKYGVKRGLRNSDGTGVIAGLTNICNVHGYLIDDGERIPDHGKLTYRGIDVADIIHGCAADNRFGFEEVIWLLIFGTQPTKKQLEDFTDIISSYRELPEYFAEDMIIKAPSANIMNKLARSVLALYSYDENPDSTALENVMRQSIQLIARLPSIMTYSYQVKRRHFDKESMYFHPLVPSEAILHTLRPDSRFSDEEAKLLDTCLILHAEHGGGNNSTFTTRVLSSSGTDTYSAIAGAIGGGLSDFIGGYFYWVVPTLLIKCMWAIVMGLIMHKVLKDKKGSFLIGAIAGGVLHIIAYTLVRVVLYGGKTAIIEIPALAFQTGAGIVIGFVIYMLLKKSGVAGRLSGMVK